MKGDFSMKVKNVTFRIDPELKEEADEIMKATGLSLSSAFNVFLKALVREGGIPPGILIDPFYRAENRNELKRRIDDFEAGKTQLERTTMKELEEEIYE